MNQTALNLIKKHEGFRSHLYKCTAGHWTIGYGYNLDANPLHLSDDALTGLRHNGISEKRAEKHLTALITDIEQDLTRRMVWFKTLNEARRAVLLDMAYQMGIGGLFAFTNTLSLIKAGQWRMAKFAMLDSKWARHDSPNRARELADIMEKGAV